MESHGCVLRPLTGDCPYEEQPNPVLFGGGLKRNVEEHLEKTSLTQLIKWVGEEFI
jgi:hypothetical protein